MTRPFALLDAVSSALAPDRAGRAVADLRQIAGRLTRLPAQQTVRGRGLEAIATTSRQLHEQVVEMHRVLRLLSIYGINIKIAAAGEQQFVDFVDGIALRLTRGEQELGGFLARLQDLTVAVSHNQQADHLLAIECEKYIPMLPQRLIEDAAALETHLGTVGTLADQAAKIACEVQNRVGLILGAMQVGDSTRQRLEHVVTALHILERIGVATDDAAAVHIHRLLAAQSTATAIDFTD